VVTHKAGVVTQGCGESLSYIFAWKDEVCIYVCVREYVCTCVKLSVHVAVLLPRSVKCAYVYVRTCGRARVCVCMCVLSFLCCKRTTTNACTHTCLCG